MRMTFKTLATITAMSVASAAMVPAVSAQTVPGLPQAAVQTQLNNCNVHQWLGLIRQNINDVQLPPGARVLDVTTGPQHDFDSRRVTVVTVRWRTIVRVYCG